MPDFFLLSDDLMFTSRVTGTARDLGYSVLVVRSGQALIDGAIKDSPRCVIIDLANPGLELAALIGTLNRLDRRPRIVAYGSHVDAAALQAARDAGCDQVMPRSKFASDLSTSMAVWINGKSETPP